MIFTIHADPKAQQKGHEKHFPYLFNTHISSFYTFFLLIFTVYWIYVGPKAHRGTDGKGHEEHFARLSCQKGTNSLEKKEKKNSKKDLCETILAKRY